MPQPHVKPRCAPMAKGELDTRSSISPRHSRGLRHAPAVKHRTGGAAARCNALPRHSRGLRHVPAAKHGTGGATARSSTSLKHNRVYGMPRPPSREREPSWQVAVPCPGTAEGHGMLQPTEQPQETSAARPSQLVLELGGAPCATTDPGESIPRKVVLMTPGSHRAPPSHRLPSTIPLHCARSEQEGHGDMMVIRPTDRDPWETPAPANWAACNSVIEEQWGPTLPERPAERTGAIGVDQTGTAGPAGRTGGMGEAVPAGMTEGTEVAGPAGRTGGMGAGGPAGRAGATGWTGVRGPTRNTGSTGPIGRTGGTEATGEPGGPSSTEATGPAGRPEATGGRGATGAIGATGLIGVLGPTRRTGTAGSTGRPGQTSGKGGTGPVGRTGATGGSGPSGRQRHWIVGVKDILPRAQ